LPPGRGRAFRGEIAETPVRERALATAHLLPGRDQHPGRRSTQAVSTAWSVAQSASCLSPDRAWRCSLPPDLWCAIASRLMEVADLDVFIAAMQDQAMADAMQDDGVLPETLVLLIEE
jgi:hypothetical protein